MSLKHSSHDDNENSRTCLENACGIGQLDTVTVLLDNGANIEAVNGGFTPLSLTVLGGHVEVAALLLDRGARLEAKLSMDGLHCMCVAATETWDLVVCLKWSPYY